MRKNVLTVLFCLGTMFSMNTQSKAQTLIDYWDFNVDSASALIPTSSIVAGASLSYTGAYYDTVQPGTILNGVGADGASLSAGSAALRLRNPAGSGSFTLTLPTTGYKNIVLAYAEERTNKGSQQNTVEYTVDGSTWINTAISATATYAVDSTDSLTNAFQLETFDFSSDASVNNNPDFKVKITFADGNTNSSGNDRYDNITLNGEVIPAAGVATVSSATNYTLYPNPVTNSLEINTATVGDKWVTILNELGQIVYAETASGSSFAINTATLTAGYYYITVRDNNGDNASTMKFIKQQ